MEISALLQRNFEALRILKKYELDMTTINWNCTTTDMQSIQISSISISRVFVRFHGRRFLR